MNHLDRTLTALAEPTRRAVVATLATGPQRASELATECGSSRASMSAHLKVLRQAGVVDVRLADDDGRGRVYALVPGALVELGAWLDQIEAFWSEQLTAFAALAEATARDEAPSP